MLLAVSALLAGGAAVARDHERARSEDGAALKLLADARDHAARRPAGTRAQLIALAARMQTPAWVGRATTARRGIVAVDPSSRPGRLVLHTRSATGAVITLTQRPGGADLGQRR